MNAGHNSEISRGNKPESNEGHKTETGVERPERKNKKNQYGGQLGRTLFFWFLALSIIPLTVVSITSYKNAYNSLSAQTNQKLEVTAKLKTDIIKKYFESGIADLHFLSDNNANELFLLELKKAYKESSKGLDKFVKSYQWAKMTGSKGRAGDLAKFRENYQYYDIWLVDDEFNVLFTVAREDEMGTNLMTGEHKDEFFAHMAMKAFDSGRPVYTDIEFHEHANDFTSFLVQAILNEAGDKVGLIFIQFDPRKLNLIMLDKTGLGRTGEVYLVGADFLLRTDPVLGLSSRILNESEKVETDIVKAWYQTYIKEGEEDKEIGSENVQKKIEAMIYTGRRGVPVLGHINHIDIAGTPLAIVAEIEETEVFGPVQTLKKIAFGMVGLTSIIVLFTAFLITRRIVNPVTTLVGATKKLEQGELKENIPVTSKDEIGNLTVSFNHMRQSMQEKEDVLRQSNAVLAEQTEIKTSIAELNDGMRGVQDLQELGNNILAYLVRHLDAQVGAMYLSEDGNTSGKTLRMVSSYAYTKENNLSGEIRFGEGIVGQAALEKERVLINDAPDDYIKVTSGLGEAAPRNILVAPILFENDVIGALEIGSFNEFDDHQINLLDLVNESIGISLNAANTRLNLKTLLDKTQTQSEELQVQQEELKESNERLQQQQEELRVSNEELIEKTKMLKSSNRRKENGDGL